MQQILSDGSKFLELTHESMFTLVLKLEDKINRFLSDMKKAGKITDSIYRHLYASGSSPGILYGLPKIHKPDVPLRPILAAYNTAMYNLAKFLIPLIEPFSTNDFTLKNSYQFYDQISSLNLPSNSFMASFDISSLYTNVPVLETINIICDSVFNNDSIFHNFTKEDFCKLLHLAVDDTYFIFNETLYKQTDGLSMGNPIAPVMANIFLCDLETRILDTCNPDFKPIFYRRYLDDTFVIFKEEHHASLFLNHLNNIHQNIKFTIERETNRQLPFLDMSISRLNNKLSSSIFRKKTFTGLGTSYFSSVPFIFKLNAIKTLLHRAYHLSSHINSFTLELDFLRNFFKTNGYPSGLIENVFRKFLNNVFSPPAPVSLAKKEEIFIQLPFIGPCSYEITKYLKRILPFYFPQIDFKFALKNDFKVKKFFPFKDKLPAEMLSNVIYQFKCCVCNDTYIGSTSKQAKVRISQHLGISYRTGNRLQNPPHSAPRIHSLDKKHYLTNDNFKILDTANNESDLRILESLYIFKNRPKLNMDSSAAPLSVVN